MAYVAKGIFLVSKKKKKFKYKIHNRLTTPIGNNSNFSLEMINTNQSTLLKFD